MPNFESHTLIGHTGREVELRYLQTGVAVADVSIAVNAIGSKEDEPPTWYKLVFWRATAETAKERIKKGDAIMVVGDRLKMEEWTAQDGSKRITPTLTVQRLVLLGRRDEAGTELGKSEEPLPF